MKLVSVKVRMFSGAAGAQKLGQPVPESNFSSDRNSAVEQHTHRYNPASWLFQYRPVNARSVPARRATANSSGVRAAFHSASLFIVFPSSTVSSRSPRSEKSASFTLLPDPAADGSAAGRSRRVESAHKAANAPGITRNARRGMPDDKGFENISNFILSPKKNPAAHEHGRSLASLPLRLHLVHFVHLVRGLGVLRLLRLLLGFRGALVHLVLRPHFVLRSHLVLRPHFVLGEGRRGDQDARHQILKKFPTHVLLLGV